MTSDEVRWHDLECGDYTEDVEVWRTLAAEAHGPVLDIGAGTGRVTLDLARAGHEVVALDAEPVLLEALRERAAAGGLVVETVAADARTFDLGRSFALVVVPMQTVQLLGGPAGRAAFLERARAHLRPGARLAVALADPLETYDGETDVPPEPDAGDFDGRHYSSLPLALVDEGDRSAIHRVRDIIGPDGGRTSEANVVYLDHVDPATLIGEAQAAGLAAEPTRWIPQTDRYIGSTVVVLRA